MKFLTFCFWFFSFWSFSVSQDVKCRPEGVEYHPLPDCTKYIICANGHPSEFQCPQGLYYNDITKNCDLPENVPDCIGGWRGPLTECGQTRLANSGVIQYKLNEPYEASEICTFILRHNYSSTARFRFVLESNGFSSFDHNALSIYTFWYYGGGLSNVRLQYPAAHLGPPNVIPIIEVDGFVAIVMFKTYSSLGTGFKLSYKVTEYPYNQTDPEYVPGTDMVFNDEATSPISDSQFTGCSEIGCVDIFVFTLSAKMAVDPEYYFKLTMSSNAEISESARNTCYTVFQFEYDDLIYEPARYCALAYEGNKTETAVFVTRGIFAIAYTNRWRGPQNVTIGWEKSPDPEN